MASTALPSCASNDPDELFICPYDPVHRISAKRFPYHLMKCRRQHGVGTLVSCPFNARHQIPQLERDYHCSVCPDKDRLRQDIEAAATGNEISQPLGYRQPEGNWVAPEASESWEDEADAPYFVPANAMTVHDDEGPVDNFTELEQVQSYQAELHAAPKQSNLASMTATQKKNYKRGLKRAEKRADDEGINGDGFREMPEDEYLARLKEKYPIRCTGSFTDWKSILNQYCQKNRINPPKYREAPGHPMGGFGSEVMVQSNVYRSTKKCTTKRDAAQDAALAAILAMNIPVGSDPTPCKPIQARSSYERERLRQTNERQLLNQAEYSQQPRQPAPVSAPPAQPATRLVASVPENGHQVMTNRMQNMTINQNGRQEDDGWTTVPKKGAKQTLKMAGRGRGIPRT